MKVSKQLTTSAKHLFNFLSLAALVIAFLYVGNRKANDSSVFEVNSHFFVPLVEHEGNSHQSSRANSTTILLPSDALQMFKKDGYVVMRGLLDSDSIDRLNMAGKSFIQIEEERMRKETNSPKTPNLFHTVGPRQLFLSPPGEDIHPELKAFREVSLDSLVPKVVAELMGLDPENDSLRIIRDIFLAKGSEKSCGWHVDGLTFWPTAARIPSNHTGINAWIAMDDMPVECGGSMVVSPGSQTADWRFDAYKVIGSLPILPRGGNISIEEYMENVDAFICDLPKAAPDLAKRIDATTKAFDLRKGDIIFADRWLFHKTVPLNDAGEKCKQQDSEYPLLMRYSIRYEAGDALLLGGLTMDESILFNYENAWRTLDEVAAYDKSPWYPRAWPAVDEDEMKRLRTHTATSMLEATTMRKKSLGNFMKHYSKVIRRYN